MAKPEWLTIKPASTEKYNEIKQTISSLNLHTVCTEANCPNITECWSSGTATFMVLGELCTRGCTFCAVSKSATGSGIDPFEPFKLAQVVQKWGLPYIVITSVCRDDMPDQGSGHFARCVEEIKKLNPGTIVELLIPDFSNDSQCLKRIVDSKPEVIGHNIETVSRLSPKVRDRRAHYGQSLQVLKNIKLIDPTRYTKSAMMLGLGETDEEVLQAMRDLRDAGVDFLAIGQYLKPKGHHAELIEYVTPHKFEFFKEKAVEMGFLYVAAGPFVRSSYKAGEHFISAIVNRK
ncbi:MAG: lipoyl synthase [Candidatus Micrarchaeota archaeon]|nr:lipoyl synthase [Candidatus Micrarchaeota archaeon]MDE1848029.1 lipoyl synthase [Candidatus Micrarchaeota archaeon]MDE1864594.1 lipoyl synthase [Candidatus Micrarchaeota archaeon]